MKVFISYQRKDKKAVMALARDIKDLEHKVWYDDAIPGGYDWWEMILEEIRGCDVFVCALSPTAVESRYCGSERNYALHLGKPIIPIRISQEKTIIPWDVKKLRFQCIDYFGEQDKRMWNRLRKAFESPVRLYRPPRDPSEIKPPECPITVMDLLRELAHKEDLTKLDEAAFVDGLRKVLNDPDLTDEARTLLRKFRSRDDLRSRTHDELAILLRGFHKPVDSRSPRTGRDRGNLPPLDFFCGRRASLEEIFDALLPDQRFWGAIILARGGMGKTALAIRAAELTTGDEFGQIVWITCKSDELTSYRGAQRRKEFVPPRYEKILEAIALQQGIAEYEALPKREREKIIIDRLEKSLALLVLDNLESLPNNHKSKVSNFLCSLPKSCRALVTTRSEGDFEWRLGRKISLGKLDWEASREILEKLAKENRNLRRASPEQLRTLWKRTDGNPLILKWVADQLSKEGRCKTIEEALTYLGRNRWGREALLFIFNDLVNGLSIDEKRMLSILCRMEKTPVLIEELAERTGLELPMAKCCLMKLESKSLVAPVGNEAQSYRPAALLPEFVHRLPFWKIRQLERPLSWRIRHLFGMR